MVYKNSIKNESGKLDSSYANDHYRALNGFKELEIPNPPQRRNRDF